jgi:hypothetical protein
LAAIVFSHGLGRVQPLLRPAFSGRFRRDSAIAPS